MHLLEVESCQGRPGTRNAIVVRHQGLSSDPGWVVAEAAFASLVKQAVNEFIVLFHLVGHVKVVIVVHEWMALLRPWPGSVFISLHSMCTLRESSRHRN